MRRVEAFVAEVLATDEHMGLDPEMLEATERELRRDLRREGGRPEKGWRRHHAMTMRDRLKATNEPAAVMTRMVLEFVFPVALALYAVAILVF